MLPSRAHCVTTSATLRMSLHLCKSFGSSRCTTIAVQYLAICIGLTEFIIFLALIYNQSGYATPHCGWFNIMSLVSTNYAKLWFATVKLFIGFQLPQSTSLTTNTQGFIQPSLMGGELPLKQSYSPWRRIRGRRPADTSTVYCSAC